MAHAFYRWEKLTDAAPFAARDGAGALIFKDRLWLLGGWNKRDKVHFPRICNSEVWSSADGAGWILEKKDAPWEGRHTAGYVVFKDRMWIVGGDANQGHYQNDVWSSADGLAWTRVCDPVPWGPRVLHYTVAFHDRIWVFGGQTLPQFAAWPEERFHADAWSSADGLIWGKEADHLPWAPRGMIGGSAVFRDRLWILGGGTYDMPGKPVRRFYNDVWSSADGIAWRRELDAAPWHPRQYHDVAAWDGRLWVMEGWDGTANRKDVWHSADGVQWEEVPDTPWLPRHAASLFAGDKGLWIVAGNNMTPDAWRLVRGGPDQSVPK